MTGRPPAGSPAPGEAAGAPEPGYRPPDAAELERLMSALRPDGRGLVAAVVQDCDSGQVLMLAWMDRQALERTLATGQVTFFSRSRQRLWRKGETSGNFQHLRSLALDCDGDALLLKVARDGPACHTGATSCFFNHVEAGVRSK